MIYDAAGNVIKTGGTTSPHDFHNTEIDASGKRSEMLSSEKKRWGSLLNMVTEVKTTVGYDGNGKAVIEGRGVQSYHAVNDPPPSGPPSVSITRFQVWSSVLGQAITKLVPDGNKWETAITAGGTTIAVDNAQTGYLIWKASDPVTGSTATFTHNGSGAARHVKEYEPLGQQVAILDPAELPDPPANESVSHWMDMEWQCTEVPQEFWDSAGSMPFHCQFKNELRASSSTSGIISIYDKDKKDGDATYVHAGAEYEEEEDIGHENLGSAITQESLSSTAKPLNIGKNTSVVEVTSQPDDCDGGVDLQNRKVDINIRCGESEPEELIDVRENALDKKSKNRKKFDEAADAVRAILEQNGGDNDCAALFGGKGIEALDKMIARVSVQVDERTFRPLIGNHKTGIRMSIPYTLLDKWPMISESYTTISPISIYVNTLGQFIRSAKVDGKLYRPEIGRMPAGTLRSRVLQLLHEVGHLVITGIKANVETRFFNGKLRVKQLPGVERVPLFGPDTDGGSDENTDRVLAVCKNQINNVGK